MNIFLYIKSIDTYKNVLLNELRNVKNEIRFYTKSYKQNNECEIEQSTKKKFQDLYAQKNHLLRDFSELNKGYTLIDSMLQQEIENIELYKRFWYLFYIQNIIYFCHACCGCFHSFHILPAGYKPSTHIGHKDENNVYLLDKVLDH